MTRQLACYLGPTRHLDASDILTQEEQIPGRELTWEMIAIAVLDSTQPFG